MDIIEQIVRMDKEAVKRVNEAVEHESSLLNETDEQLHRANRDAIEAERKEAEEFEREGEQKLNEKLRHAEELRADRCSKLDEIFESHKPQWKSEILGRITEG